MKKLLKLAGITVIVFVINMVLLLGVVGLIAVNAGPTPSGNCDCNGDGSIDLADAIYLLSHLFDGGPEPVAIAGPLPDGHIVRWPPHPSELIWIEDLDLSTYGPGALVDLVQAGPDEFLVIHAISADPGDSQYCVNGEAVAFRALRLWWVPGLPPRAGVVVQPGGSLQMLVGSVTSPTVLQRLVG